MRSKCLLFAIEYAILCNGIRCLKIVVISRLYRRPMPDLELFFVVGGVVDYSV